MKPKQTLLSVGMLLGALNFSAVNAATIWDSANEFTPLTTTNPNGVWSYGYNPASIAGYQFKAFDLFSVVAYGGSGPGWVDSTYNVFTTPSLGKNVTSSPLYGIQPGQISLHPGVAANGDEAILRFIAPTTASYNINAQFFAGDGGETDAWIVKNGLFTSPLVALGITSNNPVFSTSALLLAAGDSLDFVVGNHGSFSGDSTPLSVQISQVPLPGAAWLMLSGLVRLLGVKRRNPA